MLAFSGHPSDLLKVKRIMATLSIQLPPKQASSDEPNKPQSLEVFRPPVIVNLMNIGKQEVGNDCGLFAVAVLTSLANGVDVTKAKFDQTLMRPHLVNCIDS